MMGKGACVFLAALASVALLPRCHSQGSVRVTIASYTHGSTLTYGDSVPLGTQIILICRVVGLPYGTPLSYTWTCPNGPCEVEEYYGRKVYNEHILVVNTTSTSDGGTYTCHVTATGGQEATGNFTLNVNDGRVVHSYGRLIPHEFPITDLQQISGPDGIGRITCTVSSGTARFAVNSGNRLETGGVSQTRNGATAALLVNPSNVGRFQNRDVYCTNFSNFFYLFISSANPLSVPSLREVTNSAVQYQVQSNDGITDKVIAGYEVVRFGVPMIGQYVNAERGRRVTISPAVPGAQYRITAWALGDGRRSATPAVVDTTTGEASSGPPSLPGSSPVPTNTADTPSSHIPTSSRLSSTTAPSSSPQTPAPSSDSHCTAPTSNPLLPVIVSLVVVILLLITCVALLVLALAVTATKLNKLRAEKAHTDHLSCDNQTGGGEGETKDRIYDEVGEGTDPTGGQKGHYQELKLETMEKKQYETLHGGR